MIVSLGTLLFEYCMGLKVIVMSLDKTRKNITKYSVDSASKQGYGLVSYLKCCTCSNVQLDCNKSDRNMGNFVIALETIALSNE